MSEKIIFKPQPGFQYKALTTPADIAFLGGSAGAGKTFYLLYEGTRNLQNSRFSATIFRRTYAQITMDGGLLDESRQIYPYWNGTYNGEKKSWGFPLGSKITFRHLQHEKNIYDYQGAQIPLIMFDEITHFTEKMFLYLLTRNRSTCGIKPYIRATCNPDPDSWVYKMVKWYIDEKTGFPIPERDGVLRFFTIDGGKYIWGNSKEEVIEKAPYLFTVDKLKGSKPEDLIKSFTFIKGSIDENQILMQKDPGYLANLMAQDEATRARLLDGNWKFSNDDTQLMDIISIRDIFNNEYEGLRSDKTFITCDHARSGRDLCVVITWRGWRALRIDCLTKSDTNDIVKIINERRREFGPIPASHIIIDQDGIGVKDHFKCRVFLGGSKAFKVNNTETTYQNKKVQCYFHLAEKVVDESLLSIDLENIYVDGRRTKTVKIKGEVKEIQTLIEDDLRTVKEDKVDEEFKKRLNSKEKQKIALEGRSPDFGDALKMRSFFDLCKMPRMIK